MEPGTEGQRPRPPSGLEDQYESCGDVDYVGDVRVIADESSPGWRGNLALDEVCNGRKRERLDNIGHGESPVAAGSVVGLQQIDHSSSPAAEVQAQSCHEVSFRSDEPYRVGGHRQRDGGVGRLVAVTLADLADAFPQLWHATFPGAWESIRERGLWPAAKLLAEAGDLDSIGRFRPSIRDLGGVVLRDQLRTRSDPTASLDGVTADEWWAILNGRVYLFCREAPVRAFVASYLARGLDQDVIKVRSEELLRPVADLVEVTTVNAGVFPRTKGRSRGRGTFVALADFSMAIKTVKEVTVRGVVPVDEGAVLSVLRHGADGMVQPLWP